MSLWTNSLAFVRHSSDPRSPPLIDLYTYPTPNSVKVSIALEEMELPYEVKSIRLDEDVKKAASKILI